MSHIPQRTEKDCLNCGTSVVGRYCHECGQENVAPKESLWHLLSHFFSDITHFDGKFFSSLKDILFKPGFLSKEYMKGRRVRYLNPIRMYLFTSFIFFLIFFSTIHIDDKKFSSNFLLNGKTAEEVGKMPDKDFAEFTKLLNNGNAISRENYRHFIDSFNLATGFHFTSNTYKTKAAYDSLLATGTKKHNWVERQLIYKEIDINNKYGNKRNQVFTAIGNSLMHHFPQMLFISLPFVALLLKLLYIRQKKFYYVSHAIFTIHLYIFVFISMLLILATSKIETITNLGFVSYLKGAITLIIFFYLYKAMRNFYEQSRLKTILKYLLLLFSFWLLSIFIFIFFLFVSFFQV